MSWNAPGTCGWGRRGRLLTSYVPKKNKGSTHQTHQLYLKADNLHCPLVLSHKLGRELAEDVQESQVEWRASLSLGTRFLKCKLDTIPDKLTDRTQHWTKGSDMWFHHEGCSVSGGRGMKPYLCNIAMASLVLTWSRPKVRENRRASSLIPQNAEEDRSNPWPRSDSISLKSWQKARGYMNKHAQRIQHHAKLGGMRKSSVSSSPSTDLLQTEDEGLGTLNLVDLPSFTHCLLDDVTIIVVILLRKKGERVSEASSCTDWTVYKLAGLHPTNARTMRTTPYPHVLLEDVRSSLHFHHTIYD